MTREELLEELRREFPRFRICYKRTSQLSRAIHWALLALTFGRQREFLTGYYTVIGDTLYVPETWDALDDADCEILLRHERVHLRQRRRCRRR